MQSGPEPSAPPQPRPGMLRDIGMKFEVLSAGPEHWHWLREVIAKTARPAGNLFFDIRTVALMREHGIKEIFSADTDFLQFEGIAVTNPLLGKRK